MENMNQYTRGSEDLRAKRLQVCIWSAGMKTIGQIVKLYNEKFDDETNNKLIWRIRHTKKWAQVISYLRGRFLKDLIAIPIANKAIRLKYLQKIYDEAMTERITKTGEFGDVWALQVGAATKAIEAARTEIEGSKPSVSITNEEHLHITVAGQLQDLAKKGLDAGLRPQYATSGESV